MSAAIKAIGYVNKAIGECWQERDYSAMLAGVLLWPYFVAQQAYRARLAKLDRAARIGYTLWKARGGE